MPVKLLCTVFVWWYGKFDTLSYYTFDGIRSTPVECLHTILLGVGKYMLRSFMDQRSASEKREILARIAAFSYCGFSTHITGNIAYHYRSFVGRDFKSWLQMAMFIISPFVEQDERICWLLLAKVYINYTISLANIMCHIYM